MENSIDDCIEWAERYSSISDYESGIRELESAKKTADKEKIALPKKARDIEKELYAMKLSSELENARTLTEDNVRLSDIISSFGSRPSIS